MEGLKKPIRGYEFHIDIGTTKPAESKFQAFQDLGDMKPMDMTQLQKIIGFFGFYQDWLIYFEPRIDSWRDYISLAEKNGKVVSHVQDSNYVDGASIRCLQ